MAVQAEGGPRPETALVLVAARDDSMRRFMALLLRNTATPLVFAEDHESILAALNEGRFRVVVLVSELFGWPGQEVAQAARRSAATSHTRTVFVGHDSPGPGWEFVDAFVRLPFESNELAQRVSMALAESEEAPPV